MPPSDPLPADPPPPDPQPSDSLSLDPLPSDPLPSDPAPPDAVRELAEIPAVEVITRAAVMLMSATAEKLGLAEDGDRYVDRDEARRLIAALAGLYAAAAEDLGAHRLPIRNGLKALQAAFAENASYPDPPGQAPGERQLARAPEFADE